MPFERSEHEPEEYDPESELRDPDADGPTIPEVGRPGVDAPSVEIPSVDTDEIDVPGPIQRDFWLLVVVLKVAVPLSAAGVMLFAFEYDRSYWLPCLLAGLALFALSARRYARFRELVERTHDESAGQAPEDDANGPAVTREGGVSSSEEPPSHSDR